jgi:hypothetical protein
VDRADRGAGRQLTGHLEDRGRGRLTGRGRVTTIAGPA